MRLFSPRLHVSDLKSGIASSVPRESRSTDWISPAVRSVVFIKGTTPMTPDVENAAVVQISQLSLPFLPSIS